MGENVLSRIPGKVLGKAAAELPVADPTGPAKQSALVRLPGGQRARVTFVRLEAKRGRSTRWFWTPTRAELLPDD